MKIKLGIIFIFTLLCVFIYFFLNGTPWENYHQKKLMLTYLREKYHTDFTIQLEYDFLNGYSATASPKSKPDLKFNVSPSYDKSYVDTYPIEFWKTKEANSIKEYIFSLYPELNHTLIKLDKAFMVDLEYGPHIPSRDSVNSDSVLAIYLKQDWFEKTVEEREAELVRMKKLADYLQKKHFPVPVRIMFISTDVNHRPPDTFSEPDYGLDDGFKLDWKAIWITEEGALMGVNQ
jgi:hypothetical protein